MSKIYNGAAGLVGNTPLVRLLNIEKKYKLEAKLLAKLEYFNPSGSVKDRIAKEMIEDAEKSGKLKPGSVIIEPTSGNTGIGLASVGTAKGYKVILTMPETMSVERRNLVKAYGAEVVLTEGALGMTGAIKKAEDLKNEIDGAVILGQFVNPANPNAITGNNHALWWALSLGACLGGNLTIIGAAANVIVSETATTKGHPISFMRFMKYGALVTFISLTLSSVYLYLRYLH